MATAWEETTGRALASIGAAPALSGQSNSLQLETVTEPLKPTPGHKRAIAELALRFPAGREYDPDQYQLRLEYLAKDTAHIAVSLLRQACDRVAQTARGLPYASEIIAAATQIVEERQRVQVAADRSAPGGVQMGDRAAAYANINRQQLAAGRRLFFTDSGDQFMEGPQEPRRVMPDGTVRVLA